MSRIKLDTMDDESALRQAKKKAMAILKYMDRTEAELRFKLKQAGYREDIIDAAVEYVKSYNYIDDVRYVNNYIRYKKETKSMRQIQMELKQKGIDSDLIHKIAEKENCNDKDALLRAVAKKTNDVENLSVEQKQKLGAYLYRKGFQQEDIRKYIKL